MVPRMRGSYTFWTYLWSITHGMCDGFLLISASFKHVYSFYPTTCPKLLVCSSPTLGKGCVIQLPTSPRAKVRVPAGVFQLKGPHTKTFFVDEYWQDFVIFR